MLKQFRLRILLQACMFGFYCSTASFAQPIPLSQPWSSGLSWMEISPHDSNLIMGGKQPFSGGWIFDFQVSRDGGVNWTNEIGQLPLPDSSKVVDAVFDAASPDTVWLLTSTALGAPHLLRSVDGGLNYSICQNGIEDASPTSLFQSPFTRQLYLISTSGNSYLGKYTSIDGGDSWTEYETNLDYIYFMKFAPSNGNRVYAIGGQDQGCGIAISNDGGENWSIPDPDIVGVIDLKVDPVDENHVLYIYRSPLGEWIDLYESLDGGQTFEFIQTFFTTWGSPSLWISDDFGLFIVQEYGEIRVSSDYCESWRLIDLDLPSNIPFDFGTFEWCIRQNPNHPERLFLSNPRGLFVSDDTIHTVQFTGEGLGVGAIRDLAVAPFNSDLYAALNEWNQWVGSVDEDDILPTGHRIMLDLQVDSQESKRIYYSGEGVQYSDDEGQTIEELLLPGLGMTVNSTQLKVHPSDSDILYVAGIDGIIRSTNRGGSWVRAEVDSGLTLDNNLAVDPDVPDRVWLGCSSGLYVSDSQGEYWDCLNDTVFPKFIQPVYGNEELFLVTRDNRVLHSLDEGLSLEDFTPDGFEGEIVDVRLFRNDAIVLATSDRFYTMQIDSDEWEETAWPEVSGITCFDFLPDRHGLLVGTDSTGIWRIDNVPWVGVAEETASRSTLTAGYSLLTAYPSPFNSTLTIRYKLPEATGARIVIYNILGQAILEFSGDALPVGHHTLHFDAAGIASGVYVVRLETATHFQQRNVVLIR